MGCDVWQLQGFWPGDLGSGSGAHMGGGHMNMMMQEQARAMSERMAQKPRTINNGIINNGVINNGLMQQQVAMPGNSGQFWRGQMPGQIPGLQLSASNSMSGLSGINGLMPNHSVNQQRPDSLKSQGGQMSQMSFGVEAYTAFRSMFDPMTQNSMIGINVAAGMSGSGLQGYGMPLGRGVGLTSLNNNDLNAQRLVQQPLLHPPLPLPENMELRQHDAMPAKPAYNMNNNYSDLDAMPDILTNGGR